MLARLAFSVLTAWTPDVLVLDEFLAVGDVHFLRKCQDRLEQFKASGTTVLLVSHSPGSILENCRRCIWLDAGRVRADGPTAEVLAAYTDVGRRGGRLLVDARERRGDAGRIVALAQPLASARYQRLSSVASPCRRAIASANAAGVSARSSSRPSAAPRPAAAAVVATTGSPRAQASRMRMRTPLANGSGTPARCPPRTRQLRPPVPVPRRALERHGRAAEDVRVRIRERRADGRPHLAGEPGGGALVGQPARAARHDDRGAAGQAARSGVEGRRERRRHDRDAGLLAAERAQRARVLLGQRDGTRRAQERPALPTAVRAGPRGARATRARPARRPRRARGRTRRCARAARRAARAGERSAGGERVRLLRVHDVERTALDEPRDARLDRGQRVAARRSRAAPRALRAARLRRVRAGRPPPARPRRRRAAPRDLARVRGRHQRDRVPVVGERPKREPRDEPPAVARRPRRLRSDPQHPHRSARAYPRAGW
jgi:hypothetical protein